MNETPTTRELPTNETGLAPCPFCGSNRIDVSCYGQRPPIYVIECTDCGCEGGRKPTIAEAKEIWNRRTPLIPSVTQTPTALSKQETDLE